MTGWEWAWLAFHGMAIVAVNVICLCIYLRHSRELRAIEGRILSLERRQAETEDQS